MVALHLFELGMSSSLTLESNYQRHYARRGEKISCASQLNVPETPRTISPSRQRVVRFADEGDLTSDRGGSDNTSTSFVSDSNNTLIYANSTATGDSGCDSPQETIVSLKYIPQSDSAYTVYL